jgi:hypothetical protein
VTYLGVLITDVFGFSKYRAVFVLAVAISVYCLDRIDIQHVEHRYRIVYDRNDHRKYTVYIYM